MIQVNLHILFTIIVYILAHTHFLTYDNKMQQINLIQFVIIKENFFYFSKIILGENDI